MKARSNRASKERRHMQVCSSVESKKRSSCNQISREESKKKKKMRNSGGIISLERARAEQKMKNKMACKNSKPSLVVLKSMFT
jgi:hypothetical protein